MKRKEIEEVDDDTLWPTKRARIEPTFMIISLLPDEMIQEVALRTNRVMDMEAMACVCRDWARALTPCSNLSFWERCWSNLPLDCKRGFYLPNFAWRQRKKRIGNKIYCFLEKFYNQKEEERMALRTTLLQCQSYLPRLSFYF